MRTTVSRRGRSLLLGSALLVVGLLGLPAGRAAAAPQSCGWLVRLSGDQVNAAYPDDYAKYWIGRLAIPVGFHLELKGRFPHARYLSFITYTGQSQAIDGIADYEIGPDPGSSNPFVRGADRTVAQRSYTVKIVNAQIPAGGRAPNTIYTTNADGSKSSQGALFIIRVYVPDTGRDITGGVGLPDVAVVNDATGQATALPTCQGADVPDLGQTGALANSGLPSLGLPDTGAGGHNPPIWRKYTNAVTGQGLTALDSDLTGSLYSALVPYVNAGAPSGGFFENIHNNYVYTLVTQSSGDVVAFRASAPTTPFTDNGAPTMPTGQLRYWSYCTNTPGTNFLACLHDSQLPTDARGRYALVISTTANRPSNAIPACGVGWLPAGAQPSTPVILRNMLADSGFAQAIQRASFGTEEQTMGAYYPRGKYYRTAADFEKLGCSPAAVLGEGGGGSSGAAGGGSGGAGGAGGAGSRFGRLVLRVSPRRAVAGRSTRLRFRVTLAGSRRRSRKRGRRRSRRAQGAAVKGATVRFAGKRVTTNRRGLARMKVRLRKAGRKRAIATAPNLQSGLARVRVRRRR